MTPTRRRRLVLVLGILAGVSIAGALALNAFRRNVTFFFDPTQVAQGEVRAGQPFRLGGMVTEGSLARAPGSLEVHFVVTDFSHNVPVSYSGVLPDLFREGAGVVAHGHLDPPAPSSPTRCSPSTTRSTCRRKWRARSSAAMANRGHSRTRRPPAWDPEACCRNWAISH